MRIKTTCLILLILLTTSFSNCNNMDKKHADIEWAPTISVPEGYPVTVISGIVTYPKEGGMPILFESFLNNSWGMRNAGSMGRYSGQIPDGVGIKWYSFAEDKFYSGFFNLPYDTVKALLEKGVISLTTKGVTSYWHVIVGMAPHGVVSVWLSGEGSCVEVGNFKADEVDMKMLDALRDRYREYYTSQPELYPDDKSVRLAWRKEYLEDVPELQAMIEAKTPIPEGIWDKLYRQKFDFRSIVHFADPNAVLDMMTMTYINGEIESLFFEDVKTNVFKQRPRIVGLTFRWSYGENLMKSQIMLDPDEVLSAYKKIFEGDGNVNQAEFRVDVNAANDHIRVYLQAVGTEYPKEIELEQSDIRIYPMSAHFRNIFDVFKKQS